MRQFNLPRIFEDALTTFRRFPIVLIIAIIGTVTARQMRFFSYADDLTFDYQKIIIVAALGLSFTLALALMAERKILPIPSIVAQAIGAVILIAYWYLMPAKETDFKQYWWHQIPLFFISSHLLVSFSPYLKRLNINGFWQFNKTLFIGILTAGLYTMVLFLGLTIALVSLDKLFQIHIRNETFLDLFTYLAGIFNTWYFLYHVPNDFDALDESEEYPQGLKIFSQYILLPLVAVYLLILYLYELKIIAKFELPIGWVSNLVIAFSIAGVLCFLLLYPYGKRDENAWISRFSRLFYIIILPLLALLFVAIVYRIKAYGLTESRYLVLLTGVWLLGISLYFIISKRDNIAIIPISLSIATFLSAFGFWGAYSMSLWSQEAQFNSLLIRNNIDVKFPPTDRKILRSDAMQITSIIEYFVHRKEEKRLYDGLLGASDIAEIDTLYDGEKCTLLLERLRVPQMDSYSYNEQHKDDIISYLYPNLEGNLDYQMGFERTEEAIETRQFDWISMPHNRSDEDSLFFDKKLIIKAVGRDTNRLYFVLGNDIRTLDLRYFTHQIKKYVPDFTSSMTIPNEGMSFVFEAPGYRAKIVFESINLNCSTNDTAVVDYRYRLLVKRK